MITEILSVGTEILLGSIVNTNAAFLAEECAKLGLSCYYQQVVGDNEARLSDAIELALSRADILLISGGLGPTEDDLTKETVAKVCGLKLLEHAESKKQLEDFFAKRNKPITPNNYKQIMMPEGATVLPNPNGTAPGAIVEKEGRHIVIMPGPPMEMEAMFLKSVRPYLSELSEDKIYSVTIKETGIGESAAEDMILDLIDAQTNPTIATYAKGGEVHIRVSAKAGDLKTAKKLTAPVVKEIKKRLEPHVYTTKDDVSLEDAIIKLLIKNKMTITCAESCTGGLLSGRLISAPGASETYRYGFITYANKAKRKLIGVKKETLKKYGAVSRECAYEMAFGAADAAGADVALSVTGIAGPGGGTETKPVGLVYIGCCINGETVVNEYRFTGTRDMIRQYAVTSALRLLYESLSKKRG